MALSWAVADDDEFGVHALPFGVFSTPGEQPRVGVRVGGAVLDLAPVAAVEVVDDHQVFAEPSLDALMALGRPAWSSVRAWLQELLTSPAQEGLVAPHLVPLDDVRLHLPFTVADYVDFYCSRDHATNVGRIFRPDGDALLPNWEHLPVGYHGRAGTVVVSGTDVVRPSGQRRGDGRPVFGPSQRLDVEVEVGFVVGAPSRLGDPVPVEALQDHVFGVVLVNDWSARDVQAWEYQPLGPFLGKSFATSVSPWVLPLDALDAARVPVPPRPVELLPYLRESGSTGYDLHLSLRCGGNEVSRPPYASMAWSPAQMLAHMTVNGASLRTGDLFASGTVSGPEVDQRGSLLELTWGGRDPLALDDGTTRTFLEDGDVVTISGTAPGPDGSVVGLGEVTGRVVPARGVSASG